MPQAEYGMAEQRFRFTREQRLRTRAEFDAVFNRRQRISAGPLLAFVATNELNRTRLGISMSRRVGVAARRNRIKRMLREAFRLEQHGLPQGWDIVIVPRPHEPMPLERYRELLMKIASHITSERQ